MKPEAPADSTTLPLAMIGIRHVPPAARAKCYISSARRRKWHRRFFHLPVVHHARLAPLHLRPVAAPDHAVSRHLETGARDRDRGRIGARTIQTKQGRASICCRRRLVPGCGRLCAGLNEDHEIGTTSCALRSRGSLLAGSDQRPRRQSDSVLGGVGARFGSPAYRRLALVSKSHDERSKHAAGCTPGVARSQAGIAGIRQADERCLRTSLRAS
jgi:hypothetical protein